MRTAKHSTEQLVDLAIQFVNKNRGGFTKSGYAGIVGYNNAHILDTLVNRHPNLFTKDGKRTLFVGGHLNHVDVIEHLQIAPTVAHSTEARVLYLDQLEHLGALVTAIAKGACNALFVTGRGGIGKTEGVLRQLASLGMEDNKDFYKCSGGASAIGIYAMLYNYRNDIIVMDDSDKAMMDIQARDIIKTATDSRKVRKISWNKRSSFIYDPDNVNPPADDGVDSFPKHFNFKGRVIFISNKDLDSLDPEGAIRTRAFVIAIDPLREEVYEHMTNILDQIKLEDGLTLNREDREEVLEVVRNSKRPDVNIRQLLRAMNLKASGTPNWERLVDLYC